MRRAAEETRLEDVKSASIQYNAALDWLDCFLTDAADRDLYRTATDIYKKVFVMYYLNSERGMPCSACRRHRGSCDAAQFGAVALF